MFGQNLQNVGNVAVGASAAVTPAGLGAGTLQLVNTDASHAIYLAPGTATATSFLLAPGASVTWELVDVSVVQAFAAAGSPVLAWAVLR